MTAFPQTRVPVGNGRTAVQTIDANAAGNTVRFTVAGASRVYLHADGDGWTTATLSVNFSTGGLPHRLVVPVVYLTAAQPYTPVPIDVWFDEVVVRIETAEGSARTLNVYARTE